MSRISQVAGVCVLAAYHSVAAGGLDVFLFPPAIDVVAMIFYSFSMEDQTAVADATVARRLLMREALTTRGSAEDQSIKKGGLLL